MNGTHNCKFCRRICENNGRSCRGCAMPLSQCRVIETKPKLVCAGCRSTGPHRTLEDGRYACTKCAAIFEVLEVGFLDDRPDVNAEKRERQEEIDLERRRRAR